MRFGIYVIAFVTTVTAIAQVEVVSPYEGDKTVTVRAQGAPHTLELNVLPGTSSDAGSEQEKKAPTSIVQVANCTSTTIVPCSGIVSIHLTTALAAGQQVTVTARDMNGVQLSDGEAAVLKSEYDWGRVRAYFSGGTIIAKSKNEFSTPSIYLGLNVDYTWYRTDWTGESKDSGGHLFNTYLETRLTQVPTISTGATPDLQISANSILQSPQSGYVEGGGYVPFYFSKTRWTYKRKDNALFVAPLARLGFQTVRQNSIDGLTDAQAQAVMIGSQDVYRFIAGGARVGHFELPRNTKASPRLYSYLDLTVGRWDNLRLVKPGVTPSGGAGFRYPIRFEAEGRLQIPDRPFFVGFTMNVGSGPDDMRFLFGTRFDVDQLLTWLTPSSR